MRKAYRRQLPVSLARGLVDILADKSTQNGEVFAGPEREKGTLQKRQSIAAQDRMIPGKESGERAPRVQLSRLHYKQAGNLLISSLFMSFIAEKMRKPADLRPKPNRNPAPAYA